MTMTHETVAAEKLAYGWHVLFALFALVCAAVSVICAVMVEQMASLHSQLGAIFYMLYLMSVMNAIGMSLQALFHLWGAREHKRQIDVLRP